MNAHLNRRSFLGHSVAGLALAQAQSRVGFAQNVTPEIRWHDVREWGVEGKGWSDTAKYFDRLPARSERTVPAAVWTQSRHSAGMMVSFRTDSSEIWTDHEVGSPILSVPDLAAIGMSGLDLYAKNDEGVWQWCSVSRPRGQKMQGPLIQGLAPVERDYRIYLPLYNSTERLRIGVPAGASFTPVPPRDRHPIVFYGTSITQGASASRPGMPHVAILGRRLDIPVLNLGFGGAGKMEAEVGTLLAELDPIAYLIDCLPNMNADQVKERAAALVRQLKKSHRHVPIILVEDRTYPNAQFISARNQTQTDMRRELRSAFDSLQQEGYESLYYVSGDSLLGADREDTSDGSHPTDLGFWRQAEVLEKALRIALQAN